MTKTNAELCARIAALDPEWYRDLPGVAVKDPDTGNRFRRVEGEWYDVEEMEIVGWYGDNDTPQSQALYRALDAGPDWTDPVTVNALLGDGRVWQGLSHGAVHWSAELSDDLIGSHADRTSTILLAKLASLGG